MPVLRKILAIVLAIRIVFGAKSGCDTALLKCSYHILQSLLYNRMNLRQMGEFHVNSTGHFTNPTDLLQTL